MKSEWYKGQYLERTSEFYSFRKVAAVGSLSVELQTGVGTMEISVENSQN